MAEIRLCGTGQVTEVCGSLQKLKSLHRVGQGLSWPFRVCSGVGYVQGARCERDGRTEKQASKGSHLGVLLRPSHSCSPASVSPGAPAHLPHESFSDCP